MLGAVAHSIVLLALANGSAQDAAAVDTAQAGPTAAEWERRARIAERAGDVDGALLAWLEALVHEDTDARRAEAGRVAEPFERLLGTVRLTVPDDNRTEPLVCCSSDGVHVACSTRDVVVFEAASGRIVARLSDALARSVPAGDPLGLLPYHWPHRLAFDPKGSRIAALYDNEALILDYASGLASRIELLPLDEFARALAWRPDGARLAVAMLAESVDGDSVVASVREWDVRRQQWCVGEWEWALRRELFGLEYSPDGSILAAYGYGVHLLRRDDEGAPSSTAVPQIELDGFDARGHGSACAFHPKEPWIALIAGEWEIATWHLEEERFVGPLFGMCRTGRDELAYDPTGAQLVLGNCLGMRTYDARTGAPLTPPSRDDGHVDDWRKKYNDSPLSLAPGGAQFAMAGLEDTVRLYGDRSCEPLTPCIRHGAQVVALDLGPGGLLATATMDGSVRTWRLGREEPAPLPPKSACSVEMLTDQRHALIADLWTELAMFDRAGRRDSLRTDGELAHAGLLGMSGDGRRVAAVFSDGRSRQTLRVIDLASGADVGPPLSLGFMGHWVDTGSPPLDLPGERVHVQTFGEEFEYDVASGRCLAARGVDLALQFRPENDDAGRQILASGPRHVARADAGGNVFVTEVELERTVRIVGAEADCGEAAVGAGWYLEASGATLKAFDAETGALRFNAECLGPIAALPRHLTRDRVVIGIMRATWHVVDLDTVPREGDIRHVILERDSVARLDGPAYEPRTPRAHGNAIAWARRLFRRPRFAPPGLDLEFDSGISNPIALVHLERVDGENRWILASRRKDHTSHDVLEGHQRSRADLGYVMSAVNVEGGADVRVVDFARPGGLSLAGDPRVLLDTWRRRLGR